MRLRHYWFIVCLSNAWIVFEAGHSEKDTNDSSPVECKEGSFMLNTCEERCECKKGKLTSCYRVRKDFTKMTIEDRKRYINTYKLASVHPVVKKDYEKLIALHNTGGDQAKVPEAFLPFHRWFLVEMENVLRRIDCRVTLPYWDWSKNTHHWWRGTGDEDLWNPADHGLGGDGNYTDDNCVEDGAFSKDKWRLLDVSGGGCLRRNFTKDSLLYDIEHVKKTLSLPLEEFEQFEETVRVDYHLLPHNAIGGTMMNPLIAANAPELLLHHSFMDKLWYQWQNKGDEYKNVYFPSVPFKLYGSKYYGSEWIDSSNLPGQVKVLYEE